MNLGRCRAPLFLLVLSLTTLCLSHQALTPETLGATAPAAPSGATARANPTAATPSPSITSLPPSPTPTGEVIMTIVFDNRSFDPRLTTGWGFACLIQTPTDVVLFDTGADGRILLANMKALQIDPAQIDVLVLSHNHRDHTGGLAALLTANDHLTIFVPSTFADEIRRLADGRAQVIAVRDPTSVAEGVWALGELGTTVIEQSLAVEASQGLIVLTGCAHPGLPAIVDRARTLGQVDLLIGGFHLMDASPETIRGVIAEVQALGVKRVAPSHCTGDTAIEAFRKAYGSGFLEAGVGARVEFAR
jgi:7,8-dihydropterin-6-yl-methyl-4-(beta-D-ribofuranosyl)aminobenzene 5'-phosphate synthase